MERSNCSEVRKAGEELAKASCDLVYHSLKIKVGLVMYGKVGLGGVLLGNVMYGKDINVIWSVGGSSQ